MHLKPDSMKDEGSAVPLLALRNIDKAFGALKVLDKVSLEIKRGEVVCIIGPSGSGKSTLLRCVNNIERCDSGNIFFDGQLAFQKTVAGRIVQADEAAIQSVRCRIGMVFQSFNLFPHLSVLGNLIEAPMCVKGMHKDIATAKAKSLLEKVGLIEKCNAYPHQLSGGQQQRVAIARALAMEPELMLFDEATSALDPELVGEVLRVMRNLADDGMTMLIVTHEMSFARDVSDRVVFMVDGRIEEESSSKSFFATPRSERALQFLRNFTDVSVPTGKRTIGKRRSKS